MKTIYFDLSMGAAGDMIAGALADLFDDKAAIEKKLMSIGIPNVRIELKDDKKCGIACSHFDVYVNDEQEHQHGPSDEIKQEHRHGSSEETGPHHHHHGRSMAEIKELIAGLKVSDKVKEDVLGIYSLIAQAESTVHGESVSEIHFHEVGALDAITDITAVAFLLEELGSPRVFASPIRTGFGQVRCAHGILPVPAPATALLLEHMQCYAGDVEGEMCTPTGAAIIKYYANSMGEMPPMTIEKTGMGSGHKDFETANMVRAICGETEESILELSFNVDDMTGEELGYLMEVLLEAGALDAYTTAVGMKKNRPGVLVTVLCKAGDRDRMAELIFANSTTIGLRVAAFDRLVLTREVYEKQTPEGIIHMKKSTGYGVMKEKPEYEDVKAAAKRSGKSLYEIKKEV